MLSDTVRRSKRFRHLYVYKSGHIYDSSKRDWLTTPEYVYTKDGERATVSLDDIYDETFPAKDLKGSNHA